MTSISTPIRGPYCVACEAFYQPSEIIDGLCPIHERPVEWLEEQNYFFRLSAYADRLIELYESHPEFVQPEIRRNEVLSFVKGGLQDLSISEDLVHLGRADSLGSPPRHVRVGRCSAELHHGSGPGLATPNASPNCGRPTST